MRIPLTCLEVSDTMFHGIVPKKGIYPLGKINLDVIFGTPKTFRRERIDFEVVDWPSQYHCILGRVAFARFMAVSHYAYLQMKMQVPMASSRSTGALNDLTVATGNSTESPSPSACRRNSRD